MRKALIPAGGLFAGLLIVAVFLGSTHNGAVASAAGNTQAPTAGDGIQPELGLPVTHVVAIGTSPDAAPGEVWMYGRIGAVPVSVNGHSYSNQYALVKHADGSDWQVVPLPESMLGSPAEYGAFAGQATAAGGIVLVSGQSVVVGDPSGEPKLAPVPAPIEEASAVDRKGAVQETHAGAAGTTGSAAGGSGEESGSSASSGSEVSSGGVLGGDESLLPTSPSSDVTLPYAAIEDDTGPAGPHTGVLIAPYNDGSTSGIAAGVLHYDGEAWTREKIDTNGETLKDFVALALSCGGTSSAPDSSSPQNCWLLASAQTGSSRAHETMLLYQRVSGESGYEWKRVTVPGLLGEEGKSFPLSQGAQMLTATAQGVWVDFQAAVGASTGRESDVSELVVPNGSKAGVIGPWCYPTGADCERSLGGRLPETYRSFAWPGSGEDPGTRIITGLAHRAMLELSGGSFSYEIGPGGTSGEAPGGAAFYPPQGDAPQEGWIADAVNPDSAADGAGQAQAIKLTPNPEGSQLGEEAVPFRRPLLAVAQPPGTTPGEASSEAVAVGEAGQIGRYTPGQGWRSESLYDAQGVAQTPTLRAVAWPEPGRIYAVGDNGAMWLWRAQTGLWEPDPAEPPNFIGNLQAMAFEPGNPQLGYAVGRQGTLLKFGKSWEQVPLPANLQQVNFTSITFAGGDALATYRTLTLPAHATSQIERIETGGIAVEEVGDGMHWHVDTGAEALLDQMPESKRVLSKISGLADGGVIAAGPGKLLERESSSSQWHFSAQPLPEAANISALGAYRDSAGTLRAIVSIDLDEQLDPERFTGALEETPFKIDVPPPTEPGQPPVFLGPDLLPNSGYLLRENAEGWSDMEHEALPASSGGFPVDMPARPDPVLALLVNPSGSAGLAVGGETGDLQGRGLGPPNNVHLQTAAAERFPASTASSDGTAQAPITTQPGRASFVVAGQAACAQACSALAEDRLGPDVWLEHALRTANDIASTDGVRGFLYTGGRLPVGALQEVITKYGSEGVEQLEHESARLAQVLGSGGGTLPVYAASSEDLTDTSAGNGPFSRALAPFLPGAPVDRDYYPVRFPGPSGAEITLLVLSFVGGELEPEEESWLASELELAAASGRGPTIVMGNESLGFTLPDQNAGSAGRTVEVAKDGASVSSLLVHDGASAYFFDYPGANVQASVSDGTCSIPAYGTGTLGYVKPEDESFEADSLGSSGFLLAEVDTAVARPRCPQASETAAVSARVVPNISSLALDATNGVFLRRSEVALFEALARRAPGGVAIESGEGLELSGPDPYDKIPFDCLGSNCGDEVPSEYTFTSSNPEVGNFVEHESGSANPRQVRLGANQLPVADPHSGLFCAFNAGTTTVSVTTGGLTYSEPVTVQAGSVEYPCGTVPLKNPPALIAPAGASVPTPEAPAAPSPPAAAPQVQAVVPPAPPVPPAPAPPHPPSPPPPVFPVPLLQQLSVPVRAIVPPPPLPAGEPTPPSGTSAVFEPMQAPQEEKEEEGAVESVDNSAVSYDAYERTGPGPWLVVLAVIAAGAGVGVRRGGRRSRRGQPAYVFNGARRRRPR